MIHQALDFVLHLDRSLGDLIAQCGPWIYAILFAVVFCETGLVVTPFLPGDSLLFAAGALAALGHLNVWLLSAVLLVAAVLGDAANYAVGLYFRDHVAQGKRIKLVKPEHLRRTQAFFDRYGGRAIVIARFVPIVRTVAPFVAGVGTMNYARFAMFNVVGAVLWVGVCVGAGFGFGNVPLVKNNFLYFTLGIIVVSVLPVVIEIVRHRGGAGGAEPGESKPGAADASPD